MKVLILMAMLLASLSGCATRNHLQHSTGRNAASIPENIVTHKLLATLAEWRGTPYAWGGASKRGIDCSAFVQMTYRDQFDIDLPRATRAQRKTGQRISTRYLRPGDLVFFRPTLRSRHVGIYLGNDEFIHASTGKGVTRSNLNERYWRRALTEARRVIN